MVRRKRNHSLREITFVTLAAFILLASDVFVVSIDRRHMRSGSDLSPYVDSANTVTETMKAMRGTIYDRHGNVIAQDSKTYNIYCILDPNREALEGQITYVKDKEKTAEILAPILRMDYEEVLEYLNLYEVDGRFQTELGSKGRRLSKSIRDEIESYDLPGIGFTDSIQRMYPNSQFASNLIGYAQTDENGSTVGQMGLELFLNGYLSGTDGTRTYQVDKNGYVLPGMKETIVSATNGDNITLTIDSGIQTTLEEAMAQAAEQFGSTRVWGGAMEIATGNIVAWGQSPSFDPNTLDNITDYSNFGAQLAYEPGSTLKSFTYAAAINEGRYDPSVTTDGNIYCFTADENNNPVRTYGYDNYGCIYNANERMYGEIDVDHGLIYSLNTVTAAVQNEMITPDIHLEYMKKFGFFQPVETDGLPEASGTLNFTWPTEKVTLSFGQGSTVTMLQLMQAYSAIFGDGTMVKPHVVDAIRDPYDNSIIYKAKTEVVGEPISADTAKQVQALLYRSVNDDDGAAHYYQIPECRLIAKTGTAEMAENGRYSTTRYLHSVMAALPADDPKVLVYFAFDAPLYMQAHYNTQAAISFLRKVAISYGFTDGAGTAVDPEAEPIEEISTYSMPSLLNHSVSFAEGRLSGTGADIVVLGEGNNIIDQYPRPEGILTSGQRVFLLTDTSGFLMPDMTGWTRKDVSALWAVSGFGFRLSGDGVVESQNIPPGTAVSKGTQIEVVFQ